MSTAAIIAAIDAALVIGATRIEDEHGREIDYGTRKDMLDARGHLQGEIQQSASGRGYAINTFKISGTRG